MSADRLVNTYDQLMAAGGGVGICYRGAQKCITSAFQVIRVRKDGALIPTDINAHWLDYNKKTFRVGIMSRTGALEAAKAWVEKTYGEKGPWKRNSMGDYVPEWIAKKYRLTKREKARG